MLEAQALAPGKVALLDTKDEIVAIGHIPETPAILSIHYPRSLMRPAILQNLAVVIALGLLTLLVEVFVIRSILQQQVALPLQKLMRAARSLGTPEEQASNDLPIHSDDEIGELARDFTRMSERIHDEHQQLEAKVQERTVALEAANRRLATQSVTDELTGIANRRRFDEALTEEWRRAKRSGSYLALAMLDVDWFKKYNDHYGHQAGDECLKSVASTLQKNSNRAGDLIARYGGEEFVLIVTTSDPDSALSYARLIAKAIENLQMPHEESAFGVVTVSIGIAGTIPTENENALSLLKKADEALYRAKEAGRKKVVMA